MEHDDLSAVLAIPGLPDLSNAVRQFMLGDGPKLSMEGIRTLSDQAVLDLLAKIPGVFLVNVEADPQQLVDSHLLDVGVYSQYKGLTLPLHRYLLDRICTEWFAKLRFSTKTNYLNAIQRFAGAYEPALTTALVLPYDGPAATIDSLTQSSVDAEKMQLPSATLGVFQSALTRLVAIQLGVPAEQRPFADPYAKINVKNETLPDIENKSSSGGSAWNLLVQKWRRFAAISPAAKLHNIPAHIVVPRNTPKIKQDAVKSYGGNLILCEPTIDAREAACDDVQAENPGAVFIPPYNHSWVICGQGTIGLEFMQQTAGLDAIVVPVSGGGMISGIAVAAKSLNPSIKIIAAEPSGSNLIADVAACKLAHELIQFEKTETICDGLQARLGSITWPIVRDLVDEVVIVSEQDVVEAMKLCYERLKVVVEPSGAAGVAAVLKLKQQNPECAANLQKVGVILCGGNVDFDGKFPGFWNNWL